MIETTLSLGAVGSAMSVVALGTVEVPVPGTEWMQFGALGLCGFMVFFLCSYLKAKEQSHSEERKELARYLSRLCTLLGERKCLVNDRERLEFDRKE